MSESNVKTSRRKAQRHGHFAESLAAFALRLKGYKILARNFRTKSGEIDIIARKGDTIAIIEVKARRDLLQSVEAVGHYSQQRIRTAAGLWLSHRKDAARLSLRFDIVAVQPWKWPSHFEGAF